MSSVNASNELFSLVKIPSEKKRIFNELIESSSEIVVKASGNNLYQLIPEKISESCWILCRQVSSSLIENLEDLNYDDVIANFSIGQERYFFQTPIQASPSSVLLEMNVDLYHLQRRKNFRVNLPQKIEASCNIINYNDISALLECHVMDFSKGGVGLTLNAIKPLFKINDILIMSIRLAKGRRPFEVHGVIRHVNLNSETASQFFGVEFQNINPILEQKLFTLQMDIQSEIFRKWKNQQS